MYDSIKDRVFFYALLYKYCYLFSLVSTITSIQLNAITKNYNDIPTKNQKQNINFRGYEDRYIRM